MVTTCDTIEKPEFRVKAKTADIYEGKIARMRNAVFYLRGVPFLYLPRYTIDLEREATNIDLIPGYSSRNGAFLLTAYSIYPSEDLRATTHLDYRSERGVAVGQDFVWYNKERKRTNGYIKGYYAMDDSPYRDEEEELRLTSQGVEIPEDRYRLKVMHRKDFTDRDSLFLKAGYLSDARVEQDFFDEDFRESPIPENRATYSYRGDGYSAGVEIGKQINDEFFSGLSHLPEAYWNVPLTQIGESGLQYEGENRAGLLERTYSDFEEENGAEEYDSTRAHTSHRVYYPTRHMGWLNLIPRAGATYTYYGSTKGSDTEVGTSSSTDTNGVVTTTLSTNTVTTTEGADGRFLPEIGLEASFKAFKELHSSPTSLGRGLRHVVEPFANYTYIPEPDLERNEIFQFDSIDQLSDTHFVGFGIRNKWQTKRDRGNGRTQIHNYADINLSSGYDLRSDVEEPLSTVRLDTELLPADWLRFEMDIRYDPSLSELERIDSEIQLIHADTGNSLGLNQLYRTDRNHTLQANYRINPRGRLGFDGYTRYELEENGVEEQTIMVKYRTDCVGYGLGVSWIGGDVGSDGSQGEDDWKVWGQIWLTALPGAGLDMGAR